MTELEQKVHSNLDDALANGYDVREWDVEDIIVDLVCFASDCENEGSNDLRPHVISWLEAARKVQ